MISETTLEKLEFYKVLDFISKFCITENGKKSVLNIRPNESSFVAVREGETVTVAKELLIEFDIPPLEYLPDLFDSISISTIEGSVLEPKKIIDIYKLAVISRKAAVYLKPDKINTYLNELRESLFVDKVFEHSVNKILTENGEVKENASTKLQDIRNQIREKSADLRKAVSKIMRELSDKEIVREDYLTLRDGRIVVPVKAEHKRHIRGFIHSESATGQTVYIEPEQTLELNNEIVSLGFAEKREIERILKELTKKIGEVSFLLKRSLDSIAEIDSLFARARYSLEIIGSFPTVDNNNSFFVTDARHPILLKKNGREKTIPLNIKIENNKVIIITGPNAGGKTVVLKTIGLLSLLVNCGIHIPASADSNFYYFNKILVDIGDSQSIEDDLSTFSSHLKNINNILKEADKDSLVLLDEIGTGTDPSEGSALAAATLVKLRDKNSITLATTHHGNLKLISENEDGFQNAAMEFDHINLKPTYIFKQGIPGSSFAFEIAKRIGFNDEFLKLASNYLETDSLKAEKFLIELEAKTQAVNEKLKKAEIENSRLKGMVNLYKEKISKLDSEKKEILRKTKKEAEEFLINSNKKIESLIKEIKEKEASKDSIKEIRKEITQIQKQSNELINDEVEDESNYMLKVGDSVKIKNSHVTGKILEINEQKGSVVVQSGVIKLNVKKNELIPVNKKEDKVNIKINEIFIPQPQSFKIDIRGERAAEVEFEVLKFIDDSYSAGLNRIEILHGKGTGALKKTITEILKKHEKVKTYYFAPIDQGGDGITIAEFK